MADLSFAHPWFFLLLLAVPYFLWRYWGKHRAQQVDLRMSTLSVSTENKRPSLKALIRPLLDLLPILAFAALTIAMARPQKHLSEDKVNADGIDIVLVIDVSTSMRATDMRPNRLEAVKRVADEFVANRSYDRIGLVVFSGESFTQCPITTDLEVVRKSLTQVRMGLLSGGTAIGTALGTAVNRLKESKAESKVIILLTDGDNNAGNIDPITAAEAAAEFNIKTYTIGAGSKGVTQVRTVDEQGKPVMQNVEVNINEGMLREIAQMTEGKYYRASNNKQLVQIYDAIDKLEKTEIESYTISRTTELFYPWAWAALILLCLYTLLKQSLFRSLTTA